MRIALVLFLMILVWGFSLLQAEAAEREWWSFRLLAKPMVPVLREGAAIEMGNPIDAFIGVKLLEKGLPQSGMADARTLVRRLHFDLTGLPPSPEEVRRFEAEFAKEPQVSVAKLVDHLLDSPAYGERWARHWLDVVHYGETHGYDKDKLRENAWPYRDYVIRAFNEDKPYGRFVEEQIAGDALYPDSSEGLVAMGFLAAGPWDHIGHTEVPESKKDGRIARHLDRDDMVGNAIGVFNSLTIQCAQCHNHKFDPISAEDYYSLQAVFAAVDRTNVPYFENAAFNKPYRELVVRREALKTEIEDLKKKESAADKDRLQKVELDLAGVEKGMKGYPTPRQVYTASIHYGRGAFAGTGGQQGKPRVIQVLKRGDVDRFDGVARPGGITSLAQAFGLPARFELGDEGARRAALAKWISDDRNVLTWRSIVNRVWFYHFGKALVDTPNDFGKMGALPTHPELLDWLAVTFRDDLRGSLKQLHRLIVTSYTYLQSAAVVSDGDGANDFYSRQNRRKLDAEALRDQVLAVSGVLNPAMGGPSYKDFVIEKPEHSPHYRYDLHDPGDASTYRRSVYRFIVRSQQQPFMTVLDCADPSMRVDKRNESVSPLQSLALMNNGFMVVMAEHLSDRVRRELSGQGLEGQVGRAFQLALGRVAEAEELGALVDLAQQEGLENACRVIFNLNEFTFID